MFCSKLAAQKIASVQRRAIRAVYLDFQTSRVYLLDKYTCEPLHIKNIRDLLTEVYKSINKLNPEFMWQLFQPKITTMSFRHGTPLALPKPSASTTNSLVFRAILAWNKLPVKTKEAPSLKDFKNLIMKRNDFYCQCKSCK